MRSSSQRCARGAWSANGSKMVPKLIKTMLVPQPFRHSGGGFGRPLEMTRGAPRDCRARLDSRRHRECGRSLPWRRPWRERVPTGVRSNRFGSGLCWLDRHVIPGILVSGLGCWPQPVGIGGEGVRDFSGFGGLFVCAGPRGPGNDESE